MDKSVFASLFKLEISPIFMGKNGHPMRSMEEVSKRRCLGRLMIERLDMAVLSFSVFTLCLCALFPPKSLYFSNSESEMKLI